MNDHDNANGQESGDTPPADSAPDAEAARDAAQEPQLTGAEYEFAEPHLGAAEISSDVAESVDLDKVQAEAEAVEREAERSAQLAAAEVISAVPPANVDFKTPAAEAGRDLDESTVLRTDFTTPPVANNPGTNKAAGSAKSAETAGGSGAAAESTAAPAGETAAEPAAAAEDAPAESQKSTPLAPPAPQSPPAQPALPPPPAPQQPTSDLHDAGRAPAAAPPGAPAQGAPARGGAAEPSDGEPVQRGPAELAEGEPAQGAPAEEAPARRPYVGRGIDDGSGWHRPETPWQQSATPWQPRANAWQSPGQVAQGVADAAAAAGLAAAQAASDGAAPAAPNEPKGTTGQPGQYGRLPAQPGSQLPHGGPEVPGTQPGNQPPRGGPIQHDAAGHGGIPPQNAGPAGVPAIPPTPGYPGNAGGPGQPGGPWQGGPGQPGGPQGPGGQGTPGTPGNKNKLFIVLGVVVIGLCLVGLLIWMVFNLLVGGTKTGTAGHQAVTTAAGSSSSGQSSANQTGGGNVDVIVPQSAPLDWLEGDCLRGYAGIAKAADVVVCSSPHSAQVVGASLYPDSAPFPGVDALTAKAAAVCKAVQYTDATKNYKDLKEFRVYPTESTWDSSNDRRVDCIIVDPSGDNLKTSLIQ